MAKRLVDSELETLKRRYALATADGRHCLVCLHHHPVAMSSRWLDRVGLTNAAEFLHTIDQHKNVRAIVWGHVHQAYDGMRKGVRLLATPSTCAQFLPHADQFALDPSPPGYRRLTLCADGSIDTEVIRVPLQVGQALNQRAAGS
jgi:Icc protein